MKNETLLIIGIIFIWFVLSLFIVYKEGVDKREFQIECIKVWGQILNDNCIKIWD